MFLFDNVHITKTSFNFSFSLFSYKIFFLKGKNRNSKNLKQFCFYFNTKRQFIKRKKQKKIFLYSNEKQKFNKQINEKY